MRWGDTLSGIAARFGIELERLARANGMGRHSILWPARRFT